MNPNQQLIEHFYTCFKNKDYKGMQACYADNATFSDPVFQNLNAVQVKAMWEMLLSRAKDMELDFSNVSADEHRGQAHWDAYYTFTATGRRVINRIDASFEIENGKIVKHTDKFSFYKWARQALGFSGWLLGWTGFLHQKVSTQAMDNLNKFMAKNKN